MKLKKIRTSLMIFTLCSGMLLTSCGDSKKENEIKEKLEETYGGQFTPSGKTPVYDFPIIPSYYRYSYKWDQLEGHSRNSVYVTTKGDSYQTNANYVRYYDDLYDSFTTEIGKAFPGQIVSFHFMGHMGNFETGITDISYDEALHDQEYQLDCIIAVDDPSDHETIEKTLDNTFKGYKVRVQADIISKEVAGGLSDNTGSTEENSLEIHHGYLEQLPKHEYYQYISDTESMKGATGWYDKNAYPTSKTQSER